LSAPGRPPAGGRHDHTNRRAGRAHDHQHPDRALGCVRRDDGDRQPSELGGIVTHGKDDEVDCRDVLSDVYVFLDNECDEDQRSKIKEHLDDCYPCLRKFGIEQEVKALLARKCGGDVAPTSLRSSLKIRLSQVVITED
jgi:mycothiol system anti-sigma-R factor